MTRYYTDETELVKDSFLMLDEETVGISQAVLVNSRVLSLSQFDFRKLNNIEELNKEDQRETLEEFKRHIEKLRSLNIAPFHIIQYKNLWYPAEEKNLPSPELKLDSRISFAKIPEGMIEKWHPLDVLKETKRISFEGIMGSSPLKSMKEAILSTARNNKYTLVYFSADLRPYSENYMENSSITKAERSISIEIVDDLSQYRPENIIRRPGIERLLLPKKALSN